MYPTDIEDATTPTFATAGITPAQYAEIERDYQDLLRNELAPTEAELDEMEADYRLQNTKFYEGHATCPDPHYYCADCNRDMWLASKRRRNPNGCPEINTGLDGVMRCKRCDERHQKKQEEKNETRVSVAGRRYRAEARLTGGRWVNAGTHATEAGAWRAASAVLSGLVNGERRTA